jgi:hypothetical protein
MGLLILEWKENDFVTVHGETLFRIIFVPGVFIDDFVGRLDGRDIAHDIQHHSHGEKPKKKEKCAPFRELLIQPHPTISSNKDEYFNVMVTF